MAKNSFTENYKQFTELNKELAKKFKSTSADKNIDLFKKFGGITEYIGTGNYQLNALISGSIFGGIPNSRSIELAGLSGTGKSFLAMNIVREAQQMGYFVYYIDTEGAIDEIDMERLGIDMNGCELIKTIGMFHTLGKFVTNLIQQKEKYPDLKVMLVVDSFGMLKTQKEVDDAARGHDASDMGLRAKKGRQLFRTITLDLSNMQIPFVFTNHTAATLDLFAYDKEIPSGGGGPTFAASIILLLDKAPLREDIGGGKEQTGVILKARTYKNRLAAPQTIQFHLSFRHGMNKYFGLVDHIGWEKCMVERGTIFSADEFMKKWKDGVAKNSTGKKLKTFEFERKQDKDTILKYYFVSNPNAKTFGHGDRLENIGLDTWLSDEMFTENTLKMLDENAIKPIFQYSSIEDAIKQTQSVLMDEALEENDNEFSLTDAD